VFGFTQGETPLLQIPSSHSAAPIPVTHTPFGAIYASIQPSPQQNHFSDFRGMNVFPGKKHFNFFKNCFWSVRHQKCWNKTSEEKRKTTREKK